MKLILLGPPGSGKGTVAEFLIKKYGIHLISTGDLLREETEKRTPMGKKIWPYISKGKLVPNILVERLIKPHLDELDDKGYILDGFPRNIKQAKFLEDIVHVNKVFYLKSSDETIIKRLGGRRICNKCKMVYHVKNNPPKKQGICNKCKSKLVIREDDTPRIIRDRLNVYRNVTAPLVKYYQNEKLLVTINSNQGLKEMIRDIMLALAKD
jgi:adenylate kinase|tara:strand:+ start:510 stop:1139 length:630 start_codon:yes stop_codon:yes gene_type:complete